MQQSYAGKDISRFIAAICWLILGIVYIANIFSMSDSIKAIKAYKSYGSYYRDLYNKTMTLYVVVIGIYIAAALIAIMAMVYLIQESLAKFAKAMYCFGLGYIIVVVLALIYIVALADGNIGSVFSAFSYMGSSVTKYLMVFAVMLVLIIASIFVHGNNYIKADRGVTVGYKCFLPLVLYLATFICLGIISAMLKSDFGGYVDVSDVFGSTLKSESGLGILLWICIQFFTGLHILLREKYFLSGGYGLGGYGTNGQGMGGYGQGAYGVPPMGAPYGQQGYGVPPMGVPYGQQSYGVPPIGAPYGQPVGMVPNIGSEYKSVSPVYCNNCGALLEEGAKFCFMCGNKID